MKPCQCYSGQMLTTGAAPECPGAAALPGHLSSERARSSCSSVIGASEGRMKGTLSGSDTEEQRRSLTEDQLMSQNTERKAIRNCVRELSHGKICEMTE